IGARALAARARITGNDTDPPARQRTAERRSELRRRDRRQQLADDGFHLVCLRDVRQAREPPLEALGRAEGREEGAQPDAVAGGERVGDHSPQARLLLVSETDEVARGHGNLRLENAREIAGLLAELQGVTNAEGVERTHAVRQGALLFRGPPARRAASFAGIVAHRRGLASWAERPPGCQERAAPTAKRRLSWTGAVWRGGRCWI